jgi:hypothetical protein
VPILDLHLDVTWLAVIATFVLPMITALATARIANPGLKAGVLAFLALLVGIVNDLVANDGVGSLDLNSVVVNTVTIFLGAVGFHFGLLKPAGVTGGAGKIQLAVPSGLGNTDKTGAHDRGDLAA